MEKFLIHTLFLWCCIGCGSYATNNSAEVKFVILAQNEGQSVKSAFEEYYLKLNLEGPNITEIEHNDVLEMELCLTLASALGELFAKDLGKKTCSISFLLKNVKTDIFDDVTIKLEECICYGKKILRPFYIREYDKDIKLYFVFSTDKEEISLINDETLIILGIFDAFNRIFYQKYFPQQKQNLKLLSKEKNPVVKKEIESETTNDA